MTDATFAGMTAGEIANLWPTALWRYQTRKDLRRVGMRVCLQLRFN